ncbi:Jasmonoyl--L-amino acid synthetase JAR1 [Cardamine amara subsp. amara]|uniref:Jasmonoyl--L-amino acid synthetase JAR1 n=1 Tax=Cardamine amara subsp. amara TaxID=228776 RepID=A0ABD0ZBW3_CARAN
MLERVETFNMNIVIDEFEEMTRNADQVQKQTLKEILQKNKSAIYLQNCGLNGNSTNQEETFKAMVPLVTDIELEPYIKRMVDGDTSPILTGRPVPAISLSSGTSQGRPKFIPFTDELMENTLQLFRTAFAFRNREFPIDANGRALQFIFSSKQYISKGGVPVGTATTNVYRNPNFKAGMKSIQALCCSPDEVIFSPDVHQALYCHLLSGILFRDQVQFVFASFAHGLVHAFRTFEQVWEKILKDIETGVLSDCITVPSVRTAMSKLLTPNPELADTIRTKCLSLSNWYGLIPVLFPNAKYVYGIMTGSMEPYVQKLRHYAGDLPLVSHDYGSSEGWIAANVTPRLSPEEATFAVIPNLGYFEFLPVSETGEGDYNKPVGLTEVKIGEEYEVVITNYAGLYRYRLGDVVKIIGFYNKTPQLKFICRRNLILSINIDKNTERDLQLSVETAAKRLSEEKIEVIDFSSHVDVSTEPGHYVIFWEISGETKEDVLQDCCNCLDKAFIDAGYVGSRKCKTIGALELRVVGKGTFRKVQEHFLGLGSSAGQFKMPRCVKPSNVKVMQILCENVVDKFFSTAYDD